MEILAFMKRYFTGRTWVITRHQVTVRGLSRYMADKALQFLDRLGVAATVTSTGTNTCKLAIQKEQIWRVKDDGM